MSVRDVTDLIAGYARTIAAPVLSGTTVTRLTALGDGYEMTTDRGVWRCSAVVIATGACSVADRPADRRRAPRRSRVRDPADLPQRRRSAKPAACWSSGRRPPASNSPRRSTAAGAPSRSPSASTSECPGPTAAATSSGGPTRPASSTSGTTSSTTSSAPGTCRRPNSSARRNGARSISTRCGLGAEHRRSARPDPRRRRPVLRIAPQHLHARRPQDEPAARRPSTSGPRSPASTTRSNRPSASSPHASPRPHQPRSTSSVTTSARSSGPPATAPTTAGSTCPCSTTRQDPPRRRRRPRRAWHVRARAQRPAPPRVKLHRRRRTRHRRTGSAPPPTSRHPPDQPTANPQLLNHTTLNVGDERCRRYPIESPRRRWKASDRRFPTPRRGARAPRRGT